MRLELEIRRTRAGYDLLGDGALIASFASLRHAQAVRSRLEAAEVDRQVAAAVLGGVGYFDALRAA